jgi:hypothetical protein
LIRVLNRLVLVDLAVTVIVDVIAANLGLNIGRLTLAPDTVYTALHATLTGRSIALTGPLKPFIYETVAVIVFAVTLLATVDENRTQDVFVKAKGFATVAHQATVFGTEFCFREGAAGLTG